MTPLYRFLSTHAGPRLAAPLLMVIYAAVLLTIVLLADYHQGGHILYLDMP